MATTIISHRVSNFDSWKSVYDQYAQARAEAGFTSATVHRDSTDPNQVTILLKTSNLEGAKAYAGSSDLRSAMQKAGVQGPPDIRFLNDV